MNRVLRRAAFVWVPLAVALTGLCLVVGRSLRLVEEREQTTLALTSAAWAASVAAAAVAALASAALLA